MGRQTGRKPRRQDALARALQSNVSRTGQSSGLPHVSTFQTHPAAHDRLRLDPDGLPLRDRACLRLLARADTATAAQLAVLIYGRRRTAQDRLQRLWQAGLLERMAVPQPHPGTSPYAYRLSRAARTRLGIEGRRRAGPTMIHHTLDGTTLVCALVVAGRGTDEAPLQAWLPEPMLDGLDLGPGVEPDGLIVVDSAGRSGVLCVEIDEGTQHAGVIRPRLEAYAVALRPRPGWRLLVVVPNLARAAWYRRLASRPLTQTDRPIGLVGVIDEFVRDGIRAPVATLGGHDVEPLWAALLDSTSRRTDAPVGTAAWVELLGSGGGELLIDALHP